MCSLPSGSGHTAVSVASDGTILLTCVADGGGSGGGGGGGGTGTITEVCDDGFALADTSAVHAANALGLCTTTTSGTGFGLIAAQFVRANGDAAAAPAFEPQVGNMSHFGVNTPQAGARMLGLSSGHARDSADPGACGNPNCAGLGAGTPPPGFPAPVPNPIAAGSCPTASTVVDDVGLQVTLRAPAGAVGFTVDYMYFAMDYPTFLCTSYNDHVLILMNPPPAGALNGDIALLTNGDPITLSSAPFDSCTASTGYACPLGRTLLSGTGFDVWNSVTNGAALSWQTVTAPVTAGEEFTLRFTVMDVGDSSGDSTVLLDNFTWITGP